ncbi:hypothetical protein QL285_050142 [Trifolium repens]|jgi:hypothetical protein|nr:hypothetical protein QL285_050142 [Trifolium repens]
MTGPGPTTRSRAIATIHQGEPSNLQYVETIPKPVNKQHSHQAPQLANKTSIPVNNIFSSMHASLNPNHNQQTPLSNFQTQNTTETLIPNPPGQVSQEQRATNMF